MSSEEVHDEEEGRKLISDMVKNPEQYWDEDTSVPQLPIGAIVAFYLPPYTPPRLPIGWVVADGQEVLFDGPFKGKRVPNLMSDRFLMGASGAVGRYGGTNTIPADGSHGHAGTTSEASPIYDGVDSGTDRYPTQGKHTHSFTTNVGGNHDHGDENRPQYFSVTYIIRVA